LGENKTAMRNKASALGFVLAVLVGATGLGMDGARAGEPAPTARACPNDQVAAAGTCVAIEDAKARIDNSSLGL
jgi:hypothetical protein